MRRAAIPPALVSLSRLEVLSLANNRCACAPLSSWRRLTIATRRAQLRQALVAAAQVRRVASLDDNRCMFTHRCAHYSNSSFLPNRRNNHHRFASISMPALQVLHLWNNDLQGPIPPSLYDMVSRRSTSRSRAAPTNRATKLTMRVVRSGRVGRCAAVVVVRSAPSLHFFGHHIAAHQRTSTMIAIQRCRVLNFVACDAQLLSSLRIFSTYHNELSAIRGGAGSGRR
jgi:hypothetical protein